MESIVAAYGSSSESSHDAASSSSDSEAGCAATGDDTQVGTKRKRSDEQQWKRAFPHVDGNWPSHVRIDIPVTHELRELARHAIERAQEIVGDAVAMLAFEELGLTSTGATDYLHLSLSRPFVLTYDQINGFVDSLRAALKWQQRFSVTLRRALVLANDEKTRSFLALRVGEGEQQFTQVLRCVDQCLSRVEQPTYYKDPIPHVSIASSLGEELAQLTSDQFHVAIGNKHYDIPLR
ncbi:uncharacterized protein PITG_03564 [Phytophthora infestans T30-4]|uniref:U6 snRNA phosphodiesterase n=1 Tax=Phytophthora infestans (strain T30-4) TaxID=403677 RepID=D0MXX8_PHYIT|nr:uncharacterized protein PITG_03564 [Phytophthora infestans T30-4]EEY66026.1 hypothetical protein PITG_03564 [Phytophthora infestans T30-4]|eukprot:XP_002906625.1 hypothetical protein PITG_03564 [Phytophthora infestans T30-4]